SSAFRPKCPKSTVLPDVALPRIRPFCFLRYLTFFGINMALSPRGHRPRLYFLGLSPLFENLTFVNPHFDADDPVSRISLGESVVDIGPQCVERQSAVQVPFSSSDFSAVETSGTAHLNSLGPKPKGCVDRPPHGPTEGNSLLQLLGDTFSHQLGVQLRLVNLLNIDKNFTPCFP